MKSELPAFGSARPERAAPSSLSPGGVRDVTFVGHERNVGMNEPDLEVRQRELRWNLLVFDGKGVFASIDPTRPTELKEVRSKDLAHLRSVEPAFGSPQALLELAQLPCIAVAE
jgi:hypothetical protein